jgi:hypothetical protein
MMTSSCMSGGGRAERGGMVEEQQNVLEGMYKRYKRCTRGGTAPQWYFAACESTILDHQEIMPLPFKSLWDGYRRHVPLPSLPCHHRLCIPSPTLPLRSTAGAANWGLTPPSMWQGGKNPPPSFNKPRGRSHPSAALFAAIAISSRPVLHPKLLLPPPPFVASTLLAFVWTLVGVGRGMPHH